VTFYICKPSKPRPSARIH